MQKRHLLILFVIITTIYLLGIHIPIMEVDAAQYASMSKEMMQRGIYLHVYDRGVEYLDKPPFLFWINVVSMKIFGANNFGYRLPSILFALLAIFATYRFALLYYNRIIAQISAIVLATCQALFLITHDVRTDTVLMGWVILSVWQLAEWFKYKNWLNFIIAFIAIGGGMITKGPIALLVPVFGFGSHFLLQRNYKAIFKWQYIIGIIIIALVLLPMSIGLYQQFDLHPEKLVNGKYGVSGLRFFYWTQSFGRITGESEWDNHAGFLFLLQNMLWSFLPWIFFFLASLFVTTKVLIKKRFKTSGTEEFITYGGFLITYCSLALSHYQLPHYIFVVFPFASIITAKFIYQLCWVNYGGKLYNFFYYCHATLFLLLLLTANILISYLFSETGLISKIFIAAATITYLYIIFLNRTWHPKLFLISIFTICTINISLNSALYPALLRYQAGSSAAKWFEEHNILPGKFVIYDNDFGHSFYFYAKHFVPVTSNVAELKEGLLVLTKEEGKLKLDSLSIPYKIIFTGEDFHVSMLNLKFVNPATRNTQVQAYYILQVLKKQ
jgi:4-amino-4-deoxy-L-arabinose transferase-like glycosyltransferase